MRARGSRNRILGGPPPANSCCSAPRKPQRCATFKLSLMHLLVKYGANAARGSWHLNLALWLAKAFGISRNRLIAALAERNKLAHILRRHFPFRAGPPGVWVRGPNM